MPDYNLDRIRNIIGEIKAAYNKLEKIKELKKEEFLDSQEKIDAAKYNLIVVMEGACDICNHIAAKAGGQAPTSRVRITCQAKFLLGSWHLLFLLAKKS